MTRLIFSGRYIHNNVFMRPRSMISPTTAFKLPPGDRKPGNLLPEILINTSLIYSYGRTEDIPYGYMVELLGGRENNEFKWRTYGGLKMSYGNIFTRIGYIYGGVTLSAFYNNGRAEQGLLQGSFRYFTPLMQVGRSKVRTFVNFYYTKGFNRYTDELFT
ncbi:MAG: hypothetical protein U5L72_20055 [Bacteroidales bacterium]|nr:hypothetical protein [Bacteroidales bacterium]